MGNLRRHKDIGELNKKIKFQSLSKISDGGGGYRGAWNDFATKWAKWDKRKGLATGVAAEHITWIDSLIFTIQYDRNIYTTPVAGLRVIYPATGNMSRAYKIISINPVGGEEYFLEIECDGNEVEAV